MPLNIAGAQQILDGLKFNGDRGRNQHVRRKWSTESSSQVKLIADVAFFLGFGLAGLATLQGQTVPHATGGAHTEQVDIAYENFRDAPGGKQRKPITSCHCGEWRPRTFHAYVMQNDLWERLGKNHLVVLYDQRGTGKSKRAQKEAPHSMDAQLADLDAVRQTLGLNQFALLGDSFGGLVAMAYAAAHPEHVAKLILSDSPGPSLKNLVHLLPDVFPDIEEQNEQEAKKLGSGTDAAAKAGLLNHFRMIFY
jgi:proline iminopeptidase